ncbi:hypothetical protein ACFVS2_26765 [Brevibacillus sp. NPDC058079]|uniref:hypothetical protein n=1 Tax=Brevibacillus sp. NPDC058079 TaxID=3346330 RepID=UPI0036E6C56C
MSLKQYLFIAKLYNGLFHNRMTIFLYLSSLGFVFSLITYPLTHDLWSFFLYILVISAILTITTIRLSNNSIYSRLTKHLSMNIADFQDYHSKNYLNDRMEVAELFQEEFITAIETAHRKRCKTIRMTTHAWVYRHVMLHPRVQARYHVEAEEYGECKIPLEVLLLIAPIVIQKNPLKTFEIATKKRKQYKILLKAKTGVR